jgi:hypothetical protein
MSMREILEALWNDSAVRCPRHIVWWTHTTQQGRRSERVTGELAEPLYYAKGRLVSLKQKREGEP